ncbi:DUF192 domain-containing protein [Patescibacteria group bacterium]|nr:DUF192 domain-containing protein [Patescibacteria group bacterium]MBU1016467.1 DUF192 domain-containing protein [Patescibacteria group bacterium]MBU1684965.1 DUF192 domain-containing protein [Patescibacteria group bacterium]MBU1939007.1 DUF192 domain-containing protein [Patescibacteria group bacterium]
MIRRFFIIIGFLILVIYLAGFRTDGRFLKIVTGQVTHKLMVEVARAIEEKQLGLMGREELPDGTGMLFVYDEEEKPNPIIWMKGMLIPLDIVFIGKDLKINYIEENVQPCFAKYDRQCNLYGSAVPSAYVLELPAGFTARFGVNPADKIILPSGIQ